MQKYKNTKIEGAECSAVQCSGESRHGNKLAESVVYGL